MRALPDESGLGEQFRELRQYHVGQGRGFVCILDLRPPLRTGRKIAPCSLGRFIAWVVAFVLAAYLIATRDTTRNGDTGPEAVSPEAHCEARKVESGTDDQAVAARAIPRAAPLHARR